LSRRSAGVSPPYFKNIYIKELNKEEAALAVPEFPGGKESTCPAEE
jgi:hypothetical protein